MSDRPRPRPTLTGGSTAVAAVWVSLAAACGLGTAVEQTDRQNEVRGRGAIEVEALSAVIVEPLVVRVRARLVNRSGRAWTLRNRCAPFELELESASGWRRIEDLRSCAGPDTFLLPANSALEIEDVRPGDGGRYRLAVTTRAPEAIEVFSEPFAIR
ncbi:MAG: hypothetical protein FJ206_14735 [Gemmatimonadetes bacterium]|nr:hypothetical protein [Gemmatimonadota bacterium]